MSDKESKTEKPSQQRLQEARSEGRIARSQDLVAWVAIFASLTLVQKTAVKLARVVNTSLIGMGEIIEKPDVNAAMQFMTHTLREGFMAAIPLIGGFTVLAILGHLAQVRFVIAKKAMKPSFAKLNPMNGIKRLFSAQSAVQAAKELLKLMVLGFIAYKTLHTTIYAVAIGGPYSVNELIRVTLGAAVTFLKQAALAGVVLGLVDYGYQYKKIGGELKMTKEELKEEAKQQDGNPEVKGHIRAKARAMSRNRMMQAVKEADVVVVNPVHIAVALKYDPEVGAPKVIAKGAGFVAEKIRDNAGENSIPIVQDILLARALHKSCEIDDEIPGQMFEAVAMVLAFVFSMKKRGGANGFHKMPGTPDLEEADRIEAAQAAAAK